MNVLVVDDDPAALAWLSQFLGDRHDVTACACGGEALSRLGERAFDVVFTDLRMPPPDGFDILRSARALDPAVPVIVLTAVDGARPAVEALRLGAHDFLVKPVRADDIVQALAKVEHDTAAGPAARPVSFGLVGDSPPIRLVQRLIPALAQSRESVLIVGETGTGKELLARALHDHGPRRDGPFVAHNMAATPADLAETIFMGHARGAFSGAISDHAGLFEQAHGGTLFLDEVDSFPSALQAKLLRVLEAGCVQRVGSTASRRVDVRIVAASATELAAEVDAGRFRADLYYRLKQLEIAMPPLRERASDVPLLVRHVLEEWARETGARPCIEPAVMDRLRAYGWPGNVRELRNVVRAAAVVAGKTPIRPDHLPRALRAMPAPDGRVGWLKSQETRHILEILESVAGNQSQAARILGIDRGTLARKLSAARKTGTVSKPGADPRSSG